MTVTALYHQKSAHLLHDQTQLEILKQLQEIQDNLHKPRWRSLTRKLTQQGIYLWGSVGIGKTFLLDCFYHSFYFSQKHRAHFFQFMAMIHSELNLYAGQKNPLEKIAKRLAKKYRLIFLDEFMVKDIVDAMILANLLQALFKHNVFIIATSNTPPDSLYYRGLQREQFLPAIELIKQRMHVIHAQGKQDYRLRLLAEVPLFFIPHDLETEKHLQKLFVQLAGQQTVEYNPLLIMQRLIPTKQTTADMAWFDFRDICKIGRAKSDYLAISKQYRIIFITHLRKIMSDENNLIRLFITMIDIFYDAGTKLIFSSDVAIQDIYTEGEMLEEFKRTASRLTEMSNSKL